MRVILHYGIVEGNSKHDLEIKQFQTTEDFTKLRRKAEDRDKWKELSKMICSIARGKQCMHCKPDMLYNNNNNNNNNKYF